MPIIGAVSGGLDFSNHFLPLAHGVTAPVLAEARKQGAVLAWGSFLTIVLNFLIVAFVLFLVVRGITMLRKRVVHEQEAAPAAPRRQEVPLEQTLSRVRASICEPASIGPATTPAGNSASGANAADARQALAPLPSGARAP